MVPSLIFAVYLRPHIRSRAADAASEHLFLVKTQEPGFDSSGDRTTSADPESVDFAGPLPIMRMFSDFCQGRAPSGFACRPDADMFA